MSSLNLIILSYHKFVTEESDYPFSRTYKQFRNDLETKDFDWITMDDAHKSIIKACKMMQDLNYRAKIFVATELVGDRYHLSWDELWTLSRYHDIECHSHHHIVMTELTEDEIDFNLSTSIGLIKNYIGRMPRYFVAPYNTYDERIDEIVGKMGMNILKDRVTIKNDSR